VAGRPLVLWQSVFLPLASGRCRRSGARTKGRCIHSGIWPWLIVALLQIIPRGVCSAQEATAEISRPAPVPQGVPDTASESTNEEYAATTVFPHSDASRLWVSGQANFILQWHPAFHSPYRGPQSLNPNGENALSRVLTLYTGVQTGHYTELLLDFESASGHGISNAFGLAGYTNLDVVRNPSLGGAPYIARGMFHAVIPFGSERVKAERNPLSLFTSVPARRLEFRIGRFQLADFFDLNSAGSDSHLQFLNWTIDNNGAYDYAADTRGYTVGAVLDYEDHVWGLRFAETLMPRVANGIAFQWNLTRARAENIELELRRGFVPHRDGVIRLLSYVNHANMGDYRVAIQQFESRQTAVPEITDHPLQQTVKYGFGANVEQKLTPWLTTFGRFGWNEGRHELFVYTEVNQSVSLGGVAPGTLWRRKLDRAGIAFASNALSGDHRRYLELGGCGFLLCDGRLTYGREKILETFYTGHFWRGVFGSIGVQHINNPGYNRDRGPVLVPAIRLHLEL
jgi:high affinity Mn2+ porin